MLLVVDERAQACEGAFLILGLVARLGALDEDLLGLARVGVGPHIARAYARFHFIHVLSAGALAAEGVPLDGAFVDLNVELLSLRQHGDGGGGGVDAALRLGHRHALHAVHAALVFQCAIDLLARYREDDLLVASGCTFGEARNGNAPALRLAVLRVHAEEVACEEGSLVAARAAADFHDDVLVVLGVGGDEQQFDFLFELGNALLCGSEFFASHLAHLGVVLGGEHLLSLVDGRERLNVFGAFLDDGAQVLVFLCQLDVAALVGDDRRVGDERAHLLVA